jgi:uncharacterized membrane protein
VEPLMRVLLMLSLALLSTLPARAVATANWFDGPSGKKWVRLENPYLRLDFAPELGARGAALMDKKTGKSLIANPEARAGGGLFMDHFWEQNWPGEFLGATYNTKILSAPNGAASVKFSANASGQWGQADSPLLSGLEITRTVTLLADAPVVQVKVQIHNPTTQNKVAGYWMQNVLWAGGDKENDRYLRPNSRSVSRIGYDWKTKTPILGFMEDQFERAPTAGWTAVLDESQHSGVAFVMDYGPLMNLYNSLQDSTVEWQYLQSAIPPGRTWETEVTAIMMDGFSGLQHATPNLLLDTQFSIKPQSLDITLFAARGVQPVTSLKCNLKVLKLQSRTEVALPEVELRDLDFKTKSATVALPGAFTEPIILKVAAQVQTGDGKTQREYFEVWFGGNLGFAGINRTIDLPPMYSLPAQSKVVKFLKPDKIERTRSDVPRVLVINGYQSEAWQAAPAAKSWGAEVKESRFQQASSIAANLSYWPVDYSELMSYDAIVLSNLDASALSLFAQEMLRDYVLHGGGLVILGGMNTLGNGHFEQSRFADILPVEPGKTFEIKPLEEKAIAVKDAPEFAALGGKVVNFAHLLKPRTGARVLASAGEAPLLVAGEAGKGRVVVLGATTLGAAPPDETLLWKDAAWPQMLAQIIRWAAH